MPREQYLLDRAHHGIAIDPTGTTLCDATMGDYAALVDRTSGRYSILDVRSKPYRATDGPTGGECRVSISGDDRVAVLDYATGRQVATVPVGDHPQRVRAGVIGEMSEA